MIFPSYLHASLVALVASAVAVSAAPGLTVKKSSPGPEVEIGGSLDIADAPGSHPLFSGAKDQQSQLNAAATSATSIAFTAYAYAMSISGNTYWFNRWFGPYDASSIAVVRNIFQSIVDRDFSSFTYDCSCTRTDYFTIIDPNVPGHFLICTPFWSAPITGPYSKAGFFVYQSSRWGGNGVGDSVGGESGALKLARQNPDGAIHNAANYEYFAENSPPM